MTEPGREQVWLPDGVEEVKDGPAVAAAGGGLLAARLGLATAGVEVQVATWLQQPIVGGEIAQVATVRVDHVDKCGRFGAQHILEIKICNVKITKELAVPLPTEVLPCIFSLS